MVQSLLRDLRDAVGRDDRDRATELLRTALDEFERARARERALENTARSVRRTAASDESDVASVAHSVLVTTTRATEAKIDVDEAALTYVQGGDGEPLLEALESAIEVHDRLDAQFEELQERAADIDLPPAVNVGVPDQVVVPSGEAVDGSITVRNDGTTAVETVSVDLDTEAAVTLSTTSVEGLEPNETRTIPLSGAPTTAGVSEPSVTATTGDSTDTASFYLHVQTKRTYLEQAVDDLVQLYSEVATAAAAVDHPGSSGRNGTGKGNGTGKNDDPASASETVLPPGLENKLRTITKRTIELIGEIERGVAENPINNRIGAIVNQLDALGNQIEALAGTQLLAAAGPRLRRDIEAIGEVYADAQRAAP